MLLARRRSEQRERPGSPAPQPCQRQQAPPDQVAREVLLADIELAFLPAAADLGEGREDQVAHERFEPDGGEAVVEGRL